MATTSPDPACECAACARLDARLRPRERPGRCPSVAVCPVLGGASLQRCRPPLKTIPLCPTVQEGPVLHRHLRLWVRLFLCWLAEQLGSAWSGLVHRCPLPPTAATDSLLPPPRSSQVLHRLPRHLLAMCPVHPRLQQLPGAPGCAWRAVPLAQCAFEPARAAARLARTSCPPRRSDLQACDPDLSGNWCRPAGGKWLQCLACKTTMGWVWKGERGPGRCLRVNCFRRWCCRTVAAARLCASSLRHAGLPLCLQATAPEHAGMSMPKLGKGHPWLAGTVALSSCVSFLPLSLSLMTLHRRLTIRTPLRGTFDCCPDPALPRTFSIFKNAIVNLNACFAAL